MPKKNTIILSVLGILIILVLLVSTTLAIFTIQTNADKETTKVDINSAAVGTIAFSTKTRDLHFLINENDMSSTNVGTKYYATDNMSKNYLTESERKAHILAEISSTGGKDSYSCDYDYKVYLASDNTMVPSKKGEIVLSFFGDSNITSGEIIDIFDLKDNEIHLKGKFAKIDPNSEVKQILMELYVMNTSNDQQLNLANKKLNVIIEPVSSNLNCTKIVK